MNMQMLAHIRVRVLSEMVFGVIALLTLAFAATRLTLAEPNTPLAGGKFTVNSTTDGNTSDNELTLTEALLLASGGTGAGGLNRALSAGEQTLVAGCVISGGLITGGCGATITDTIVFSLSMPATITLGTTFLPLISDSAPTIIDGTNVSPTIDTSSVTGSHIGLHVSSANNVIKSIGIANASLHDFSISGFHNRLSKVWAWNAGTNGIFISTANSNTIESAFVGVESPDASDCNGNKGNTLNGILVNGGAFNVISDSVISCNGGNGIRLENSAHNTTIVGNDVGTNVCCNPLPNGANGLLIQGGAHDNIVAALSGGNSNYFLYNTLNGIVISGTNTATNTLFASYAENNNLDGVVITDSAHNNTIGDPNSFFASGSNIQDGILLAAGAHDNLLNVFEAIANAHNGIELAGVGTTGNVISASTSWQNGYDGINERNGATFNRWTQVNIHDNGGLGIDKNAPNDTSNNIDPPFPIITSVTCNGTGCTVKGTATPPGSGSSLIELYFADADPSGYGEGATWSGSTFADANGNWSLLTGVNLYYCRTALQTHTTFGGVSTSSEFGPHTCRSYLPIIVNTH